jgi:hypothetical protein
MLHLTCCSAYAYAAPSVCVVFLLCDFLPEWNGMRPLYHAGFAVGRWCMGQGSNQCSTPRKSSRGMGF